MHVIPFAVSAAAVTHITAKNIIVRSDCPSLIDHIVTKIITANGKTTITSKTRLSVVISSRDLRVFKITFTAHNTASINTVPTAAMHSAIIITPAKTCSAGTISAVIKYE